MFNIIYVRAPGIQGPKLPLRFHTLFFCFSEFMKMFWHCHWSIVFWYLHLMRNMQNVLEDNSVYICSWKPLYKETNSLQNSVHLLWFSYGQYSKNIFPCQSLSFNRLSEPFTWSDSVTVLAVCIAINTTTQRFWALSIHRA